LFFESQDALVAQDVNGQVQDVYEWEPQGVGSCARVSGCVSLISSGTSPTDSMFMDSSANGSDVFFITRQSLLGRDQDHYLDLYDARVDGGFTEASTAQCAGEGCRGSLTIAPSSLVAGSSLFGGGPGNFPQAPVSSVAVTVKRASSLTRAQKLNRALRACTKKPTRERVSCRSRARRRYGPVTVKSAKHSTHATKKGGK
jgi:hypothetical protein